MSAQSKIEWTDATWNPIRGSEGRWSCTKISEGCSHCYGERLNIRFGGPEYKVDADTLRLDEWVLEQPLRWKRPRRIFVCSMTDLFEERVPDEWVDKIFDIMLQTPHTFQVLTKRAKRMSQFVKQFLSPALLPTILENIWLGISAENQKRLDQRAPWLMETPASVRFLSIEPMLGQVDPRRYLFLKQKHQLVPGYNWYLPGPGRGLIHWVIVGGESGGPPERTLVKRETWPGEGGRKYGPWEPRPEALEWVRSIRDACIAAGVPLFFKQWGGPIPKSGGYLLDKQIWHQFPGKTNSPPSPRKGEPLCPNSPSPLPSP